MRRYQNAWRRRSYGASQVLRMKLRDPAQLELNFCAEPWRPLVVVAAAAAAAQPDRPMTDEELAAEFERLFP